MGLCLCLVCDWRSSAWQTTLGKRCPAVAILLSLQLQSINISDIAYKIYSFELAILNTYNELMQSVLTAIKSI
jgi:hypothetical protein